MLTVGRPLFNREKNFLESKAQRRRDKKEMKEIVE